MSLPDTDKELEALKKKALRRFHDNHDDGDLAIYALAREFKALHHQSLEAARREARIDELERLSLRGHVAERASVPNKDDIAQFDRPDWVTIQTPIFYVFASTIPGRIAQLKSPGKPSREKEEL